MDSGFWKYRRVLVTGHSGFKGGWLSSWLLEMGALVSGFSLPPNTDPSFFESCRLDGKMKSFMGDIRNGALLYEVICEQDPEIIFHLAAQPLVRASYQDPVETFSTNVMGTVNLLEAARRSPGLRVLVIITTDKCYENKEWIWGYRETEPLGGDDPYSASKACAELVSKAYRQSFFKNANLAGVATVRAGNVIGGGDWGVDRLLPDAIRAFHQGQPLLVRSPHSVRPWQHVLEPLSGYLELAEKLYEDKEKWAGAWNFGPSGEEAVNVATLAEKIIRTWGCGRWEAHPQVNAPHESSFLKLDSSKARESLGWKSRLNLDQSIEMTITWYREALSSNSFEKVYNLTCKQIHDYENLSQGITGIASAATRSDH